MIGTALIKEVPDFSIEAIKKAFIKQHQQQAANEQVVRPKADMDQLEAVKRWIAPSEFKLGLKAVVLQCASVGMAEDLAAQIVDGNLYLLANCISNEKQARDCFTYGAVGLVLIPRYLTGFNEDSISQIYHCIPDDHIESMLSEYDAGVMNNKRLVVELYLAELATLNITPSYYERRDSWQRMLLRKLYSKLKWNSHDLHYLVYRATKNT